MSNLPVLWQNCLLQFKTDIAQKAWLWFAANKGSGSQYAADRYAGEVEAIALAVCPLMQFGAALPDEKQSDLLQFILTRHANWRIGANVKPDYLRVAA